MTIISRIRRIYAAQSSQAMACKANDHCMAFECQRAAMSMGLRIYGPSAETRTCETTSICPKTLEVARPRLFRALRPRSKHLNPKAMPPNPKPPLQRLVSCASSFPCEARGQRLHSPGKKSCAFLQNPSLGFGSGFRIVFSPKP